LEQAAARELAKETGVAVERLEIKGFMCHFWPNGQFVTTFLRVYVSTDVVKLNSEKSDF
jgi:ADP-ribose pyrophosphatase YjhB (NUDIX family)